MNQPNDIAAARSTEACDEHAADDKDTYADDVIADDVIGWEAFPRPDRLDNRPCHRHGRKQA